jgi:sensor domain CHASE-containing protein
LAAPGLGLVIIGALAFAMVVERSVERQEQELWDSRVSRAKNEIEHVAANLRGLVKDYAFWDEIIIFADQPSDLWARDELLWLEQFQGIDFVLVFDRSGAIVYASELAKSVNAAESLEASFGALRQLALARPGELALWAPQGERGVGSSPERFTQARREPSSFLVKASSSSDMMCPTTS